jgi:hypothetical protein
MKLLHLKTPDGRDVAIVVEKIFYIYRRDSEQTSVIFGMGVDEHLTVNKPFESVVAKLADTAVTCPVIPEAERGTWVPPAALYGGGPLPSPPPLDDKLRDLIGRLARAIPLTATNCHGDHCWLKNCRSCYDPPGWVDAELRDNESLVNEASEWLKGMKP